MNLERHTNPEACHQEDSLPGTHGAAWDTHPSHAAGQHKQKPGRLNAAKFWQEYKNNPGFTGQTAYSISKDWNP